MDPRSIRSPSLAAGNQSTPLMVVGIGASAGGLKALQLLVEAVPADSGMAFVVILHLAPERESRMGELLQDRAAIPVMQVTGVTAVEANRIYIIPPAHDLVMHGLSLGLRERGERSDHAPVDLFFRTLAEACGSEAAGVILSGTGVDGTSGIRYIRQAGGITVAQEPDESEYDGMPASAIATGLVDLVLPAAAIPAALLRLLKPAARAEAESDGDTPADKAAVADVLAELHRQTGHDFSQYKRATVMRRLDRRLRFNEVTTLRDYLPLLRASSTEGPALLRDLLISVSGFFRDPDAFEALAAAVPALFSGKGPADTVRVWVVGCATGEEVYSVAMVLAEHAETLADPPRIQMFATDIDGQGYAWARAGLYSAAAVASVTPERLRRFFTKESDGYRAVKSLRALVLFAGHNVLHDPPFSRIDLISCRNLFIYLKPQAQDRVLETFHFSLSPGGLLFLGAAESIGDSDLFVGAGAGTERLYRRNLAPNRLPPRISGADPLPRASSPDGAAVAPAAQSPRFSYGELHVRMLEQYAAASVIVNERLDVVHLSAGAGQFLQLGEGEPSRHLLDLARGDLRRVLRTSLHYAFARGVPSTRQLPTTLNGKPTQMVVQVRPAEPNGDGAGKFALVVFETSEAGPPGSASPLGNGAAGPGDVGAEEELSRTRELLETTTAAHDHIVAELQTVNEELRSINEEQRAATEELETGREEIQSINEELTTINQEYQSTIEELKHTNADLQNLIESTGIGTIFLDRTLQIRRFTPAVCSFFNFVATDQGRAFADITHRLDYPHLARDVARVLAEQVRMESEAVSDTGEAYIVRISPYRSLEGGNDGVVLTFFDNTVQHRVQEELREAKANAEQANLAKGTFLSTLSHEFRTPLNAILGYADLVSLDGPLTAAQEQKLGRIRAGSWHLAAMIEELLSFAKLDDGREVVRPESVDARTVAREAADLMEIAANGKGLAMRLDVPDTPVPLVSDSAKARMILVNLCGNAVKFTESGEVRLSVRGEAERVSFDVSDTGIGVAPENLARVFDRFWQVDGASTRAAGGLGIGLAAAREYARLLGGDVELESEQGRGSTFRLWLPLVYEAR